MIEIVTTKGTIAITLYDETPRHKDNFLKLVQEETYVNTLFHRVINNFMIQAGDPDSKDAPAGKSLGTGDVGYTIPAEIVYPKYFHKRGALCAARQGDQVNPERNSSGCQFYIVTGTTYSQEMMLGMEQQRNQRKVKTCFDQLVKEQMKTIYKLRKAKDQDGLEELQNHLIELAEVRANATPDFTFTPDQIETYTNIGGTPHLDGEYTVFGEVVEGMDIVDAIQGVDTDKNDRPSEDIRILEVKEV